MPVPIHEVQFQRNKVSGIHRALCSCGWFFHSFKLEEAQDRAASHDLEWECVAEATAPQPVAP